MSCHVMSCPVLSCHVMSCHVMSCPVLSCHVMSLHNTTTICHIQSKLATAVGSLDLFLGLDEDRLGLNVSADLKAASNK
jgi:hypothetical protein